MAKDVKLALGFFTLSKKCLKLVGFLMAIWFWDWGIKYF